MEELDVADETSRKTTNTTHYIYIVCESPERLARPDTGDSQLHIFQPYGYIYHIVCDDTAKMRLL